MSLVCKVVAMSPVRSLVCKVVCHLYDCGIVINLVAGNVTLHAVLTAYIYWKDLKRKVASLLCSALLYVAD